MAWLGSPRASASSWALGNVLMRTAGKVEMFPMMVWLSLVPPIPLFALSLVFEGWPAIVSGVTGMGLVGAGSVLYLALLATLVGFGLWGFLLKNHPASTVAPFSLLVPLFGTLSSWLVLGETFSPLRVAGMLLILAGLVVGSGASPGRGFAVAGSYVLSMALVYASLGVLAALLGANLQALLQQPWLLGSFAALFVLLALPMFGFFELQLPGALRDRLESAGRGRKGGSLIGAGVLGALSGLLVGPCMTAPLAGALLYIAQSGNAVQGGLVLFTLGVGIGMPLLLLVTVGSRFLPKPGAWMNLMKGLFGFLFLGTALLLVRPVLDESLWLALWGVLLLIVAGSLWQQAQQFLRVKALFAPLGLLAGLWGSLMLIGAAGGSTDPWQPLQVYTAKTVAGSPSQTAHDAFITVNNPADLERELAAAKAQGQWVMLDYYADWCVSCKVMEKKVFGQPQVMQALNGVRLLRLDVTDDTVASRDLLSRYQVPGPPTFIWIGPNGIERRAQRITGEVNAETFLNNWQATRELL